MTMAFCTSAGLVPTVFFLFKNPYISVAVSNSFPFLN